MKTISSCLKTCPRSRLRISKPGRILTPLLSGKTARYRANTVNSSLLLSRTLRNACIASKFSYIVYGDTRGRLDGVELQYEHGLVVDSMLAVIKQLETTEYPVRWVLQ